MEKWKKLYLKAGFIMPQSGVLEKAFVLNDVIHLLLLLQEERTPLYGFEVWKKHDDGVYRIESLSGWVPENNIDINLKYQEAQYLLEGYIGKSDYAFTLQFKDSGVL